LNHDSWCLQALSLSVPREATEPGQPLAAMLTALDGHDLDFEE
jgi:hypothetical protein